MGDTVSQRRPIAALKTAALYLRMSRDSQEDSIPSQRKALQELARTANYRIVAEYSDSGISGDATEKRTGFQRLMGDCSKGRFSVILCWDQDRFGRFDSLESGFWIKPMRDAGVVLHTIAQGVIDWEKFEGRVMWALQAEAKHNLLRDMSRNILRGQRDSVLEGNWIGPAPYGYRKESLRLVIYEPEAVFVRWLFRTLLSGASLRSLITSAAKMPQKPRRALLWSPSSIAAMLKNRAYIGCMVWNQNHQGKYHRLESNGIVKSGGRRKTPNDDLIVIPHNHPALIAESDFQKVQRRLADNRTRTTSPKLAYLLSGKLRCGHCGYAMVGSTRLTNGVRYSYYSCGGYAKQGFGFCTFRGIAVAKLEADVKQQLMDFLQNGGIQGLLEQKLKEAKGTRKGTAKLEQARLRVVDVERKIKQSAARLSEMPDNVLPIIRQHMDELSAELDEARAEFQKVEASTWTPEQIGEMARRADAASKRLAAWLRSSDRDTVVNAIEALVERITLHFHEGHAKHKKHRLKTAYIDIKSPSEIVSVV